MRYKAWKCRVYPAAQTRHPEDLSSVMQLAFSLINHLAPLPEDRGLQFRSKKEFGQAPHKIQQVGGRPMSIEDIFSRSSNLAAC